MSAPLVSLTVEGAVAVIRFTNPPEGYMVPATEPALAEALDRVEADPAVRVVILTGGQPGVFIRHFSLEVLHRRTVKLREKGITFSVDDRAPEPLLHQCMRRIETSAKPYIAAINGHAMGGGYELALACDLRLAEAGDYHIGLPEVRAGLLPGAGGTQRLTRLVGEAVALELILTGTTLTPDQAARRGLVTRCVDGPVMVAAMEQAQMLARLDPGALAAAKRLVRGDGPDPARMAEERTRFAMVMVSDAAAARLERLVEAGGDIRAIPPLIHFDDKEPR